MSVAVEAVWALAIAADRHCNRTLSRGILVPEFGCRPHGGGLWQPRIMNAIEIAVPTLAVLGTAALGAIVLLAIHRGQQRSQFRDRLRNAYVDFFASVDIVKVAKIKLLGDIRMSKAGSLDRSRLDASNRQFLDTMTDIHRGINTIRLLEVEKEFLNEIEAIASKVEAMIRQQDFEAVNANAGALSDDVHHLISTITKAHPLLALKKARSHHGPATSS